MKNFFLMSLLMLSLQACSTIYFQSDDRINSTAYSEWHHDWLYGLIEGSDAVDMNARCKGADWRVIKTEQSFLQGLVETVTYNLYNPHGVEYSCVRAAKKK
jgi:hypothetical protein